MLVGCLAWFALVPHGQAQSLGCGLEDARPLWIDFADGSVSFAESVFGRAGVVAATRGRQPGADLRQRGAKTVHWHMELPDIVGNLKAPHSGARVKRETRTLIENARATTGCQTPTIALNELFGASIPTPWPRNVARYRANVLLTMKQLAASGARPFLLVHGKARGARAPSTVGRAADWWKAVARHGFIVRQMHFDGPRAHSLGVQAGSRTRRVAMRRALSSFTRLGIAPRRLGLLLGFQSGPGKGGREGLGRRAWLETIRRETLAARRVAAEYGIRTIWSWGWGTFNAAGADPDKRAAACVHLWTRDPTLCDGPAAAGGGFDTSLSAGQIELPAGAHCRSDLGTVSRADVLELERVLGSRKRAVGALFMELVAARHGPALTPSDVRAIERAIVAERFAGSRRSYEAALRRRGIGPERARSILANGLQRAAIKVGTLLRPHQGRRSSLRHRYRNARQSVVCARDNIPSHRLFSWARELPLLALPRQSLSISARRASGAAAKVRLSGKLTGARGVIAIYASSSPEGPYARLGTTRTAAGGSWQLAVRSGRRTSFRAISLASISTPVTVVLDRASAASR